MSSASVVIRSPWNSRKGTRMPESAVTRSAGRRHARELMERVHRDVVQRPAARLAEVPRRVDGDTAQASTPLGLLALVVRLEAPPQIAQATSPIAPESSSSRVRIICGRRTSREATSRRSRSRAGAISSSASATVVDMVLFTCVSPASSASRQCSKWRPIGDAIVTASTSPLPSRSSMLVKMFGTPNRSAAPWTRSSTGSHTATTIRSEMSGCVRCGRMPRRRARRCRLRRSEAGAVVHSTRSALLRSKQPLVENPSRR